MERAVSMATGSPASRLRGQGQARTANRNVWQDDGGAELLERRFLGEQLTLVAHFDDSGQETHCLGYELRGLGVWVKKGASEGTPKLQRVALRSIAMNSTHPRALE